jgi:hypothetical protein
MRITAVQCFLMAVIFLSKASLGADATGNPVAGFDLFGFPLSALDQGLGKRADALGQALIATFPKDFQAQDFKENFYNGRCFVTGSDQYKLSWRDSETEGFSFTVERSKDQKFCANPFTEGQTFKSGPLNPSQFFPISHSHSSLVLGVSTSAEIQKELGRPAYSNPAKLIYVLKRDKLKEKNCGMKPSKGEFYAIDVEFDFSDGILRSVTLVNSIAGEC